jgi:hypothetical protein
MKTQKEMRKAFWQFLKKCSPSLYAKGKRSKGQNEQITDIRVTFCAWLDCQDITEKQKQNWTL